MNISLSLASLSEVQRNHYRQVIRHATRDGIPFAAGGSLALAYHARLNRCFKDLDLYTLPEDKDRLIAILNEAGFEDYYDRAPYDRGWIYRGFLDDVIVDIIWTMANRRASVDAAWLNRGPVVDFNGDPLRLMPVEEMIWTKLYVLQRERCDWPDLLNVLDWTSARIDWPYLLGRIGSDAPLLASVAQVFCWLKPERTADFPRELWLAMPTFLGEQGSRETTTARAALLDSRPWLTSLEENGCE